MRQLISQQLILFLNSLASYWTGNPLNVPHSFYHSFKHINQDRTKATVTKRPFETQQDLPSIHAPHAYQFFGSLLYIRVVDLASTLTPFSSTESSEVDLQLCSLSNINKVCCHHQPISLLTFIHSGYSPSFVEKRHTYIEVTYHTTIH